ncbi:MAG: hypothetical protein WCD37_10935 [Chloroflexia bacterium]
MSQQKAHMVTVDVFTYVYQEVTPAMVRDTLEQKAKAEIASKFAGRKVVRIEHKQVLIEPDSNRQMQGLDRHYRATLRTDLWVVSE